MNDNEKYVDTLEEILDSYAKDCENAVNTIVESCVSVIKIFNQAMISRDIIETEVSKMHEMIYCITRNYEEKSNRIGVIALDLGIKLKECHFKNMYEYAKLKLQSVQDAEFKYMTIDLRIDEF